MRSFGCLALFAVIWTSLGCSDGGHAPAVNPYGFDAATTEASVVADSGTTDGATPTTDAAPPPVEPTLTIAKVAGATVWGTQLKRMLAVDKKERVFVCDGKSIFVYEAGVASAYVTSAELQAHFGSLSEPNIGALDVDADGKLYLYAFTNKPRILQIPAAHEVVTYLDLAGVDIAAGFGRLTAVSPDRLLAIDYNGMAEVTKTGVKRLTNAPEVKWRNCGGEALSARSDGFFYFAPGCNGNDFWAGAADGPNAKVIATEKELQVLAPKYEFVSISSATRDPVGGGALLNIETGIVRFAKDPRPDGSHAWWLVPTKPTLRELGDSEKLRIRFSNAPIAAAYGGAIYLLAYEEGNLYRAAKP